jgi:mRNA-degrading endonuclease RelE of RelBE toxin-antitoxin system
MHMHFTERFLRTAKKLPRHIIEDTAKAIDHLLHPSAREPLHVYPLEGRLRGLSSLTINYDYQAVVIANEGAIIFLDIAHRF